MSKGYRISASTGLDRGDRDHQQDQLCLLTHPRVPGCLLGVVADAYSPGDDAVVQTGYVLEHAGWTWAPGPVLVGLSGQLAQAPPAGALFAQVIGQALSSTRVLIDINPPITLA